MPSVRIVQDSNTESPRDWDNLGKMIAFHGRYNLGDGHGYKSDDYSGWAEMEKAILKDNPGGIILPLFLYDHSGITIATSPFDCRWDSGQVGFIVAPADEVRRCWATKRITAKVREAATRSLRAEVHTYDQYLRGEVYGFQVLDDNGKVTDSCYGFYGGDPFKNGMSEHIPDELHDALRNATVA